MEKIIHHVRHIRQKPEKVRRHILHVLIIICAVLLGLLWVYSLGTKISGTSSKVKQEEGVKPFSALKDNIIGGYKSLNSDEPIQ